MWLPLYKLVIWRSEGSHITTMDYMESPILKRLDDSLLGLINCDVSSLEVTEEMLRKVNSTPEIQKSRFKYVLVRTESRGSSYHNPSYGFVFKLADFGPKSSVSVKESTVPSEDSKIIPKPITKPKIESVIPIDSKPSVSTRNFHPQYMFAVIKTKVDGSLFHICYDCADNPITGVYQGSQLINIYSWPEIYHELLNKLTRKINGNQELLGASGKYYLSGAGVYEDEKSRYVVWRFVDTGSHSVDLLSQTGDDDSVSSSGIVTPTSTVF